MRQNVIIDAVPEDLVHKLTKEKTGDSMQVGLNIKIKRIGRGYTQEEIADAIGVARSTYTRYESDKRLPDIYKLCALADYFDVSLDDLVGRDWKPKKDHKGGTLRSNHSRNVYQLGVNPPADIASGRAHIVRWTMVLRRPKRSVDLQRCAVEVCHAIA